MKVVDHRGREAPWSFKGCRVSGDETRPRSSYHKRARPLVAAAFPHEIVYEEVPVPGTRLRFDFVVPARRVAVEVQGEQHYALNTHMHKGAAGFSASLARDHAKAEFCLRNGIRLVLLKYSETDDEWRDALEGREG